MLDKDINDILRKSISVCSRHKLYIEYCLDKLGPLFPLNQTTFDHLSPSDVSIVDQLIFRFSKLQDQIGSRLLPALLDYLYEDTESLSFKDLLFKAEKLQIIPSAGEWLELRETRNLVSHDYPDHPEKIIEGLNLLFEKSNRLLETFRHINLYILNKLPGELSDQIQPAGK